MSTTIHVQGIPAPQGSKIRTPYGMRESSQAVMPWREAVKAAVRTAPTPIEPVDGPVEVDAIFYFARPKSHYGTGRNSGTLKASAPPFPTTKRIGDIDKLQRSTFDALTESGVIEDDSMIVNTWSKKKWAAAGQVPGATIEIRPARTTTTQKEQ